MTIRAKIQLVVIVILLIIVIVLLYMNVSAHQYEVLQNIGSK